MKSTTFFKVKQPHFPQISRFFSERRWKLASIPFFWLGFGLCLLIVIAAVFTTTSGFIYETARAAVKKEVLPDLATISHYDYWKKIAEERPDYRDGQMQAALFAKRLGRTGDALRFLDRTLVIDPRYEVAKELKEQLLR